MSVSYDYYKNLLLCGEIQKYYSRSQCALPVPAYRQPHDPESGNRAGLSAVYRNKGVVLTPEGEILYRYVSRAHRSITQAEGGAHGGTFPEQRGVLRIAATEMTMQNFLMPYLKRYHSLYPSIKLEISNGTTSEGAADAGFQSGRPGRDHPSPSRRMTSCWCRSCGPSMTCALPGNNMNT